MIPSKKKSIYLDVNGCRIGRIKSVDKTLAGPFLTKTQGLNEVLSLRKSGKVDRQTSLRLNSQIRNSHLDETPPYKQGVI